MWARVTNRKLHGKISTKHVLVTALLVDLFDLLINIALAMFTGSLVMVVMALQCLASLAAVSTLLYGYRASRKRPNKQHPFGYGKELYFWSVLAAFAVVASIALVAFNLGAAEFLFPTPVEHLAIGYLFLGVTVVTNAYAFWVGAEKLLEGKPFHDLVHTFMRSPMIAPKTTLVLDAMGTLTALAALATLGAYGFDGDPHIDGLGTILMSIVLGVFSIILLTSLHSLINNQGAAPETEEAIRQAALKVPEVRDVLGVSTMLLGTHSTLVTVEVHIKNDLSTDKIERIIADVKKRIQAIGPGMRVHVEPDAR